MATTIEQQVAMDVVLVPSTQRIRIKRSNFRLPSDIQSKESTLQLVYDVLRRCLFFKAFLITADVPEIYMQEFWATANLHQHSIQFMMDNKKHILDLESFRNMLHICPRVQAIINKCLTGKSSGYDSFWLSQAQILWGLYHKRNIDYDFLIWEDFMYQVEHKNHKKSNKMYYPRFTKVIIHHFMSKDPSIPRRNKVNWHYVRDDFMFSTIKVVSRHQNTQQYGAMLPIELTNDEIRNTKAYKEYYACATGEAAPKPMASARRKRSGPDTSITPLTTTTTLKPTVDVTPKLTAAVKGKQPAKPKNLSTPSEVARTEAQQLKIVLKRSRQQTHISQPSGFGTDEGTGSKPGVLDVPTDESEEELSWNSSDDEGADDQEKVDDDDEDQEVDDEETRVEESFDPIPRIPESSEDEGNGEENQGLNVHEEEEHIKEEEEDELYKDVNINQGRGLQVTQDVEDSHVTLTPINSDGQQESSSVSSQFVTNMLNQTSDAGMESIFATASTSVAPLPITAPTMTPSTVTTITTTNQALIPPTPTSSEVLQTLPTFALVFRINDRLRSLEQNFSEVMQTNQFAGVVFAILGIVQHFMDQRMNEAVQVAVQLQLDRLREEAKKENDEFLKTFDENIKKIIKEQIILDTYGETVTPKRRRDDDEDKDEEPSTGTDWGSKRRKKGKEPESASTPSKPATRSASRSTTGSKSRQASTSESAFVEEPISELVKQADTRSSFNELMDTPLDFSNFIMNRLRVDTLTPELLARPTYDLVKGSCKSLIELKYHLEEVYKATIDQLDRVNPEGQQYPHNLLQPLPLIPDNRGRLVIPFADFINNDLEYLRGGASSRKYTTSVTKTKAADYGHIKWIEDLVPWTMWIQEPIDYDKHALWESLTGGVNVSSSTVLLLTRNLLAMYIPRGRSLLLRLQDIKDMLLLLVQGKLSNLTVEERFAFNVSLRMFTRSIVIQRCVEDLQLGVESYQKRLNLTKPDTYRSDLKRREAYTAYSNPRGFIYQNKDKKNRSILTDLQETLKRKWRYLILADSQIHNHMLIPDYQDIIFQDFCYFDEFECYQVIKIGRQSISHEIHVKDQAKVQKSIILTTNHKIKNKVYELKTRGIVC
nr:hypothetical protein [Tanacetum cinerariifolium]